MTKREGGRTLSRDERGTTPRIGRGQAEVLEGGRAGAI